MGYLGFVFDLSLLDNKNFSLNDIDLNTDFLVIFIEKENLIGNHIIGFSNFFKKDNSKFVFLKSNFGFGKFLFFDNTIFKYGKICVNDKKVLDFEFNTIWFSPKDYKILRDLIIINDLNLDLEKRMKMILPYFF